MRLSSPRLAVVALAFLVAPALAVEPHLVTRSGQAMGTLVQVRVYTVDDAAAQPAIQAAFDEIDRLEKLMTTWRPDSKKTASPRPTRASSC